jgi:hypothetical protein
VFPEYLQRLADGRGKPGLAEWVDAYLGCRWHKDLPI